jgi:hypothetical protein
MRLAVVAVVAFLVGTVSGGVVVASSHVLETVTLQPGQQITIRAAVPSSAPAPACHVDVGGVFGGVDHLLYGTGLTPGVEYGAWWSISKTDGGQPFYFASTNVRPAREDGMAVFVLDGDRHGYWEVYIFQPPYSYDEDRAVAECEFHD